MSQVGNQCHGQWLRMIALFVACSLPVIADAESPTSPSPVFSDELLEFFEKEVRPLLDKRCYECHSARAKKLQGGLRLDSRAAVLEGGDTGPAVVPGKPKRSLLVDAINYGELYQMPPRSKLPKKEIAALTKWIELGAPWPKENAAVAKSSGDSSGFDLAERRAAHWAWQPIERPTPSAVKNLSWPADDIDRFILAKLELKGLAPAEAADKRTLIRRAFFDLVGLPPTPEAVDRFLGDESPRAFERVVDELLASPRFGERWARHWLDLIRYAETYGHEFDYPIEHAWQYRDYVVRALNADVPYDQFTIEHIAGDLLSEPRLHPTEKFNESVIGTGFWWFGEQVHAPVDVYDHEADRVDNQIDVLGKTFLGLTLGCARCHDHKFDAISTADVYSLWGFAKSTRLQMASLDPHGRIAAAAREIDAIQRDLTSVGNARSLPAVAGGVPSAELTNHPRPLHDKAFADFDGDDFTGWFVTGEAFGDRPTRGGDWTSRDGKMHWLPAGSAHSGRLSHKFTGALRSKNFTIKEPQIAYRIAGKDAQVRLIIQGYRMDTFNPLLFSGGSFKVDHEDLKWHVQAGDLRNHLGKRAYIEILDDGDGWVAVDEIRFVEAGSEPPEDASSSQEAAPAHELARASEKLTAAAAKIAAVEKTIPTPMRVLAATDGDGFDDRIHIRGNTKTLGDVTPRRFLTAIADDQQLAIPPDAGSGRLQLAQYVVSRDNPLFARVLANRIWQHLFGRGIVATVDNFGVLGDRPSHSELLDHLATRFIDEGYSIKRLIRAMMLSRTYQIASRASAKLDEADPNNLLIHRQNLKRLEGEALRDAMLSLSGRLDLTMYGPPVRTYLTPFMFGRGRPNQSGPLDGAGRRSIYLEVRRNFLSPMMLAFDTPLPASTVGRRNVSNVPAQSLILMNDPFVAEQARRWAERSLFSASGERESPDSAGLRVTSKEEVQRTKDESGDEVRHRIEWLYREAFARPPSDKEVDIAAEFVKQQAAEYGESPWRRSLAAWTDLCHTLFNAKEFVFMD
ncbi:MAG: PSD1 and planctomycete cytochrome C domain-containing protein [Pirellulales bacterium]